MRNTLIKNSANISNAAHVYSANPSSGVRSITRLTPLLAVLLLVGCATKLDKLPEEAQITVPETWQASPTASADGKSDESQAPKEPAENSAEDAVKTGWLTRFEDQDLTKYVSIALQNNPDLWGSAAQLKTAIEQVTINGASLWPSAQVQFNQNDTSQETGGVTTDFRTVNETLTINWEADIWGKLTQRRRSSAYSASAQAELYNAAELSLVANVSRGWYNLMTNKLQLDLAEQRLESFQNTAKLIEENYERGLRSALDVYLSRTDVQRQVSDLSSSKFNYISSLRSFKTLLGEYPSLVMELDAKLPTLTGSVPIGLPAELLTRRPDIKASRLQYKAQIANAKAAHRDRFPTINFTGTIGESSGEFNQLFDDSSVIQRLITNVTLPLFRAGALKSRQEQAYYQAEAAYADLVRTTLAAFEEVENSLTREQTLQDQHTAILEAVRLAQGGLDLALDRYQTGIENYTTVLQSQRALFDSMQAEINLRNALLQNRIGIHLALGGDFATEEQRMNNQELPSPVQASTTAASPDEPDASGGDE